MIDLRKKNGFTLVEILVVVGVIALLTAILLPVLGRVRESGRARSCASNLKQLGLAFQQYRSDWNGRFPRAGSFQQWGKGGHWVAGQNDYRIGDFDALKDELKSGALGFDADSNPTDGCAAPCTSPNTANVEAGALYPYVKNSSVYICPSNRLGAARKLSYSMNCAVAMMSEARIRQTSDIILLVDEETANDGWFFAADTNLTRREAGFIQDGGNSTDRLTEKHNGGGNLLFVDSHVKFFSSRSFPLDDSVEGWANKGRLTGTPRFHDPAFGKWGSYDYRGLKEVFDSCAVKIDQTTP